MGRVRLSRRTTRLVALAPSCISWTSCGHTDVAVDMDMDGLVSLNSMPFMSVTSRENAGIELLKPSERNPHQQPRQPTSG